MCDVTQHIVLLVSPFHYRRSRRGSFLELASRVVVVVVVVGGGGDEHSENQSLIVASMLLYFYLQSRNCIDTVSVFHMVEEAIAMPTMLSSGGERDAHHCKNEILTYYY
jgi:vacuolar-type H+-ATPase catalytic subunit A/Vma1